MAELVNPKYERMCQLRAEGYSQRKSYRIVFERDTDHGNAAKLFRKPEIKQRVDEVVRRRAVLADLDEAWVLMQLKAVARNGVVVGSVNLDDFYVKDKKTGERLYIDLAKVSKEKMAALEEVTVEEFVDGEQRTVRRTKVKLRSASDVIKATELIGKYLRMWKEGLSSDSINGPPVIEVFWRGSPDETTEPAALLSDEAPALLTDQTNDHAGSNQASG